MAHDSVVFERTVTEAVRRAALIAATKHDLALGVSTSEAHSDTNDAATLAAAEAHDTDALLAVSDVTTNNVTSTKHGFAPKSPADATKFLNGAATPAYAQVKDSDLSTSDVTTNNVVSTKHGLAPKSPADATKFLNGAATPAYAQVKDSDLSTSDITTNNVSITKHGFAPKAPNDATKYLDGTGAYSTPAGGTTYPPTLPTFPAISNLELRLSAELSTMTVNPDGRVAQINDMTGNWGSNFTATLGARPRLVKRAMSRLRPGLVFDGVAAKLVAGATKTLAQPVTVVGVVQNWKGGAANNNMFHGGGLVVYHSGGNSWAIFAGTAYTDTTAYTQNTEMMVDGDIGAPAIAIAVFNGATSTIYNNGVNGSLSNAGAGGFSGTLYVGGDSTTSFAHMVLYEFLVYSKVLNGTELGQINTYYATALDIQL